MKDPAIRYEINRKVKATLTRHAVDLTLLQYSTAAEVVYLFGALKKDPEGDFSSSQVESLVKDLAAIPEVRDLSFELNNWSLIYEPGFVTINKTR